jgi:CBS domain containing-hemolysin-like protein
LVAGIAVAGLWLLVFVLAMGESALTFASRAKLEESIARPALRNRYIRYLDRSGPAKMFCVICRACAVALVVLVVSRQTESRIVACALAAAPIALAEVSGRLIGRRLSPLVLIVLLPPLQIAWWLTHPFRSAATEQTEAPPARPNEQVVDAAIEEIRVAVEDAATEGAIRAEEKEMIEGVLAFEDAEVYRLMTPRLDMECLEVKTPMREALRMAEQFHHSRIPVYEDTRDRIVGIVHVRDLLHASLRPDADNISLRDVMRPPFFVPETKHALSLLRDFKQQRVQIAIVLDEYGGVIGLVTIEDVVEEIVGDIEDHLQKRPAESRIRKVGPAAFEVDARTRIEQVNKILSLSLPENADYETVGGFVMKRLARVPKKGQETRHDGVLFRVVDCDQRRVLRVLIQLPEPLGGRSP